MSYSLPITKGVLRNVHYLLRSMWYEFPCAVPLL